MSGRERPSLIGKVEYEPDPARIVDGLVDVLTYRAPSEVEAIRFVHRLALRAARRAREGTPTEPPRRADELSPAQQARARAAHARRLAAEKREGEL